jgi:hypothetical protein
MGGVKKVPPTNALDTTTPPLHKNRRKLRHKDLKTRKEWFSPNHIKKTYTNRNPITIINIKKQEENQNL